MGSEPLLVVDVQRCFINDYTRHVPDRIRRLVDLGTFEPVLWTRFVNTPESPYHRLLRWHSCSEPAETELVPELAAMANGEDVYVKEGLTGVPNALAERLQREGIKQISIVGIDTDMCVLKVAMDVFDLGIEPVILVDCCASTGGLQSHLAGLSILSRNIGPHQLRFTRLHETYLAGPADDPTPSGQA
ncbi:MAG: cysteine hydrolase [Chloroflexi bacterium]|nr:cysteine hydrolase [Chloroflexota bacterium]MBV9133416.1 cysteine hydrolase [Chloroflexota bacterium]MBV9894601.1 cysteine hydrolase [Chloroflexota bacterium]